VRLRTRILLAQAPVGGLLALVGIVAIWLVNVLTTETGQVLSQGFRTVLTLQRLNEAVERVDNAALLMLAGERELGLAQARAYATVVQNALGEAAAEDESFPMLKALWSDMFAEVESLPDQTGVDAARRHYFQSIEPKVVAFRRAAGDLLTRDQDALSRRNDLIERVAGRTTAIIVVVAMAAFALGSWLSVVFTGRALRPLRELAEVSRRIGAGDLAARAAVGGRDEVGKLAQDFNQMAKRLEDYRKSSLGELLQAQLSLLAAIDGLPDPVLVLGLDGALTTVNTAAIQILGLPAQPSGPDALAAADPLVASTVATLAQHVLGGRGPYLPTGFADALRVRRGDGEYWLLPRANPVYEPGAGIVGVTLIFQDVTRLRGLDQVKNDMMATVAHEFRAPLTSLRMAIHLCLEGVVGPLTDKQEDLLFGARDECERLETMVDDLLDLSRLESGRVSLSIGPAPLADALDPAVEAATPIAAVRGARIDVDMPPIMEDALIDAERMTNVFRNLIDNAVRFTPANGAVRIAARVEGEFVRVTVRDQGPGIDPRFLPRLFDKFFRVPGAPPGGAGLGLAIAREIVVAHGGQIGVESEVGEGSTFWFTVPILVTEPADPRPAAAEETE
jgi:signal transduction histidine kinase